MNDHDHMALSIPPKYRAANTVGFVKAKSAVRIHREPMGNRRVTGLHFWAAGYGANTVSYDEEKIRRHVREQESRDRDMDQRQLDFSDLRDPRSVHSVEPASGFARGWL